MRRFVSPALFALIAATATSFGQVPAYVEPTPDLGPQVQIALPGTGDYDLYESGIVIELQFRDWVSDPWGYLLAIGYGEWTADSGASNPGAELYDFDGNVELAPFGASLICKALSADDYNVTLEAGLRYIAVDSKISARNRGQSPDDRFDVEIDDSVIARFGAGFDYFLNEDFILSLGIAYQKDLESSSLTTELGPARDNSFESFMVEAALRMPL